MPSLSTVACLEAAPHFFPVLALTQMHCRESRILNKVLCPGSLFGMGGILFCFSFFCFWLNRTAGKARGDPASEGQGKVAKVSMPKMLSPSFCPHSEPLVAVSWLKEPPATLARVFVPSSCLCFGPSSPRTACSRDRQASDLGKCKTFLKADRLPKIHRHLLRGTRAESEKEGMLFASGRCPYGFWAWLHNSLLLLPVTT